MPRAGWVVAGLLLSVGCQPNTTPKAEVATAQNRVTAASAMPATVVGSGLPFVGYHRYRGTVGGQPVTVELTIGQAENAPDSTNSSGSYTYDRHPTGLLLLHSARPFLGQLPLALVEADTARPRQPTGHWQAVQPAGPVLTGTWRGPAGQGLPFSLHEDYTDRQGHLVSVRYELLQEGEEAPSQSERRAGESKAACRARTQYLTSSSSRDFLHLLGPDTLRSFLRALQCPVPVKRRQQLREDLGYPGHVELRDELTVSYNDHGLLSLASFHEADYEGAVHPEHGASAITYDLRTSRELTIAELICPGTDTILSRLITQHLAQADNITAEELFGSTLAPLPQQGLGIEDEGLAFTYVQPVFPPMTVVVPYPELLPLLRTASPVAQMLRARGLWRISQKQ